jgi:hydroxymethylglutaryl-CoA reductase (NADPH)
MSIEQIKQDYIDQKIKTQHLETIIFKEVYASDAANVSDACALAAQVRCEVLEQKTGADLTLIKNTKVNTSALVNGDIILPGIESKIGGAIIPMGFVEPAKIDGQYVSKDEELFIPLATNEAALIAGVQRGLKAINMSGGLKTLVNFDGMTRAPLIEAPDIYQAREFINQIKDNQSFIEELQQCVPDPFVALKGIDPYQLGTKVFLRLIFKTGDAMGMNGVTKASAEITRYILRKMPTWKLITISSNLCSDKKNAHINVLNGRGKAIQTEVFITEETLQKVFKKGVNSRSVEKTVFHKCYLGSCLSGTISGFNVNAANAVGAFFAAMGQDLAQVISSSSAFVQADSRDGGLHFMVSLPCMELATIGGGTMFGTAKEALKMIGCGGFGTSIDDNKNVLRLAEIAATVVTALDLNTACAQAAGYEMADSHVRLARGEKE